MTPRRLSFVATAIILALTFTGRATLQEALPPEYGPAKGTLVIVGGGGTDGTGIIEKFIELAGGNDAKFVIVPTAGGNKAQDGSIRPTRKRKSSPPGCKRGIKNVKMLHTHDPKVADTEEFVKVLRQANAVWFNGGRQWNIVDSYANTLTYKRVSQGARARRRDRRQLRRRDDSGRVPGARRYVSGANVMMTPEPNHQKAFEFLRKSAIDQHINARNRWDDLIPVIAEVSEPPRHRPVGRHRDHRQGRHASR